MIEKYVIVLIINTPVDFQLTVVFGPHFFLFNDVNSLCPVPGVIVVSLTVQIDKHDLVNQVFPKSCLKLRL